MPAISRLPARYTGAGTRAFSRKGRSLAARSLRFRRSRAVPSAHRVARIGSKEWDKIRSWAQRRLDSGKAARLERRGRMSLFSRTFITRPLTENNGLLPVSISYK